MCPVGLIQVRIFSDVLNMKRVRSCEDVRALSDADCTPAPPVQPLGDFTDLPIEVIYTVLEYLPGNAIDSNNFM